MLEYMLKQAQQLAVGEIFLEVRETNLPAQSLYTRHGFIQIDRRKGYYPSLPINGLVTSAREDALIMRWESS
jgi:ribosomal-protein-alanine N-acetyltransferase